MNALLDQPIADRDIRVQLDPGISVDSQIDPGFKPRRQVDPGGKLRVQVDPGWTTRPQIDPGDRLRIQIDPDNWLRIHTALHAFGPGSWGVVLSAQSAGLFVMSAVMYRLKPRRLLRFGYLCLPFGALPLITLSLSTSVAWLCVTSFIAGLSFDALNVAWATSLQTHVPAGLLSRVSAIDNVGAFAAIPLGQIAVSPIAAIAGTGQVEAVGGLLFAALAALPLAVPEIRTLSQPSKQTGR